jgi:putative adhesin
METQTAVQRRFETDERVALDLRIPAGRIEVEAANGEPTVVELTPLDGGDESARAIDDATVEVRSKRGGRRLVVDVSGRHFGRDAKILLRVTCPSGADLDARTASADLSTHGPLGSADVKTASGDLSLDVVTGGLDVKTASGDLSVASVHRSASVNSASGDISIGRIGGNAKIHVASGEVNVREADGSLSIHSASGDQLIGAVQAGEVVLKTASGDLSVGVREGSTVRVDARSMSGAMTSEIELGESPVGDTAGGPHVDLRAMSMSGDVRITRA